MIIRFTIIITLFFITFRLLGFLYNLSKLPVNTRYHLSYILPLFELFVWAVCLFWIAKQLFYLKNYFGLISLAIGLLLTIILLFVPAKDLVYGIFLKMQNRILEGIYLDLGNFKGIVKKVGQFRLDIENSSGDIASIPYHTIHSKIILRPGNNQNLEKITLEFIMEETNSVNEIITQLKKEVLNNPWVAVSQPPIIESVKTEDGKLFINIGAFVLKKSYAENIKAAVISYLRQTESKS